MRVLSLVIIIMVLATLSSCTTFESSIIAKEAEFNIHPLRSGKTCSKNLFGGFKLPYIKDTDIKLSGSESLVDAIMDGDIVEVFVVEKSTLHYVFYTKRCIIVHGI
jgi:hypothetical protein